MLFTDVSKSMVAIWLGTCDRDSKAELQYINKTGKRKSQLSKDLNSPIDLDLFLWQTTDNDEILPIEQLVKQLHCDYDVDEIIRVAKEKSVLAGNRMFSYHFSEFTENEPNKSYCGLTFIGNFKML